MNCFEILLGSLLWMISYTEPWLLCKWFVLHLRAQKKYYATRFVLVQTKRGAVIPLSHSAWSRTANPQKIKTTVRILTKYWYLRRAEPTIIDSMCEHRVYIEMRTMKQIFIIIIYLIYCIIYKFINVSVPKCSVLCEKYKYLVKAVSTSPGRNRNSVDQIERVFIKWLKISDNWAWIAGGAHQPQVAGAVLDKKTNI